MLDQLPEGGVEVKPGRTVYITINAFRQKQVPVPYVAGRSLRQAKNMLEIAGLEIERLVYRPDIATNYVLEEYCDNRPVRPESKIEAEAGSGVTLYVGVQTGDSLTIVPQVIGATLRQAKSPAVGAGSQRRADRLRRRHRPHQPEGRPGLHPDPGSRTAAVLGTPVELRLTLDADKLTKSRSEATKQAAAAAEERMRLERERDSLREAGAQTVPPQPETTEEQQPESRPKQQVSEPDEFFD